MNNTIKLMLESICLFVCVLNTQEEAYKTEEQQKAIECLEKAAFWLMEDGLKRNQHN